MHWSHTPQYSWQLILPDVSQPLCDGVLDHFVDTEEANMFEDTHPPYLKDEKHSLSHKRAR